MLGIEDIKDFLSFKKQEKIKKEKKEEEIKSFERLKNACLKKHLTKKEYCELFKIPEYLYIEELEKDK